MDLSLFFEDLSACYEEIVQSAHAQSLKSVIWSYVDTFPDVTQANIILIGCPHYMGQAVSDKENAPNVIRKYLYSLATPVENAKIVDLGNLKIEGNFYEIISKVLEHLLKLDKTVILLGGTHDTAYGQFLAYQHLEQFIEYVSIDSKLDLLDADLGLSNRTFHNQIFRHKPNYLKHFSNIGTQIYYVSEAEKKAIKSLQFESVRLSEHRQNVKRTEPYFRTANMVSLDLSAVRQSDAPGVYSPSPAGFTAEEICQIARFIGMGYYVSSFSINELDVQNDGHHQTSHLAAMILWHFIEGFYNRVKDEPAADRSNLRCFIADLENNVVPDIIFYKSERTGRWWMEVPYPNQGKKLSPKLSKLVPCCEEDYITAIGGDIPERWWLMHCKFMEELV